MLRWVFFDVGNVLLDEDPLTYRNFRLHVEAVRQARPDRTFAALLAEREARAIAGSHWPLHDVVSTYLDEARCAEVWNASTRAIHTDYAALSPPVTGAAELIERLGAHYHLGLIANQGTECRAQLAALGWLDLFEVVAFSEELGLFKPDPALFLHALARAVVDPSEALMVGDRLDNDITPASALGMLTAWLRWPRRAEKGWPPTDNDADPEALAYLASLERISTQAEIQRGRIVPTIVLDTISELGRRFEEQGF